MLQPSQSRLAAAALLVWALASAPAFAQSEQEKRPSNEAEQILRDAQKQDAETPKEIAECLSQWDPSSQMTKEEWAASCKSTLRYFPETPPAH